MATRRRLTYSDDLYMLRIYCCYDPPDARPPGGPSRRSRREPSGRAATYLGYVGPTIRTTPQYARPPGGCAPASNVISSSGCDAAGHIGPTARPRFRSGRRISPDASPPGGVAFSGASEIFFSGRSWAAVCSRWLRYGR